MDILILLTLSVMPALTIVAGLKDITSMTIPNWISAALVIGFFPAALAVGLSPMTILSHVGVGMAALIVAMVMFALRVFGGGDAKLMAATCLWMGLAGTGPFVLWTAVIGGVFGLALILARQHAQPLVAGAPAWFGTLMTPKGDIPYGVAIAAGALMAYPTSPLIQAFLAR
jgi:prepilin peptidase CpaA